MFGWLLRCALTASAISTAHSAASIAASNRYKAREAPEDVTSPPDTQNLGSVFRCSGEGAEVLVLLGLDQRSFTWSCTDVKS